MYINSQSFAQITESEIRALNPNTSFTVPFVPPAGYEYIFPAPVPTHNPITQYVVSAAPELTVLGHWEQRWTIEALATEQVDANLTALCASKTASIKAERDRRKFNGVYVSNKWIHTDADSRTQWIAMVIMGASVPAIEWTTMDNTSITTSQSLASEVFQATATLDATLFAHAKSLIASVDASNDPASIDITAGWPDTFVP